MALSAAERQCFSRLIEDAGNLKGVQRANLEQIGNVWKFFANCFQHRQIIVLIQAKPLLNLFCNLW